MNNMIGPLRFPISAQSLVPPAADNWEEVLLDPTTSFQVSEAQRLKREVSQLRSELERATRQRDALLLQVATAESCRQEAVAASRKRSKCMAYMMVGAVVIAMLFGFSQWSSKVNDVVREDSPTIFMKSRPSKPSLASNHSSRYSALPRTSP